MTDETIHLIDGCVRRYLNGRPCGRPACEPSLGYGVPLCSPHLDRLANELLERESREIERCHSELRRTEEWHGRLKRIKGRTRPNDESWLYEYEIPANPSVVGSKRRRVRRTGFRNEREARRAMRASLVELVVRPAETIAALDAELDAMKTRRRERITQVRAGIRGEQAADVLAERRRRRDTERRRVVYYVQRPDGAIKIGTTWSLPKRLQSLRNVAQVTVLAAHLGGQPAEAAMHRRFAHLRLDGEWFTPADELLSHVSAVRARRTIVGDDIGARIKAVAS